MKVIMEKRQEKGISELIAKSYCNSMLRNGHQPF